MSLIIINNTNYNHIVYLCDYNMIDYQPIPN